MHCYSQICQVSIFLLNLSTIMVNIGTKMITSWSKFSTGESSHKVLGIIEQHWLCDHHKGSIKVKQTHVMTSFRDSIAFSSVILSGLSSDVCFFMSAKVEKFLRRSRQEEIR